MSLGSLGVLAHLKRSIAFTERSLLWLLQRSLLLTAAALSAARRGLSHAPPCAPALAHNTCRSPAAATRTKEKKGKARAKTKTSNSN